MAPPRKRFPLKSLLVLVLGLALLGLAVQAIFGPRGYLEIQRLEEGNQELTGQVEGLETENEGMLEEIQWLKSDPEYIEKIAREELGLVRKGEIKIVTQPSREDGVRDQPE